MTPLNFYLQSLYSYFGKCSFHKCMASRGRQRDNDMEKNKVFAPDILRKRCINILNRSDLINPRKTQRNKTIGLFPIISADCSQPYMALMWFWVALIKLKVIFLNLADLNPITPFWRRCFVILCTVVQNNIFLTFRGGGDTTLNKQRNYLLILIYLFLIVLLYNRQYSKSSRRATTMRRNIYTIKGTYYSSRDYFYLLTKCSADLTGGAKLKAIMLMHA